MVALPVRDMRLWKPTSHAIWTHEKERFWCNLEKQYYLRHKDTKEVEWYLPQELHIDDTKKPDARVLVIVADEGSTGWSLCQWLALKEELRFLAQSPAPSIIRFVHQCPEEHPMPY